MKYLIALVFLFGCSGGDKPIDPTSERYYKVVHENVTVEGEVFDADDLASEKAKIESALLLAD
jgi:hypothetical protein